MANFLDSTLGFIFIMVTLYVVMFGLGGVVIAKKFDRHHAIGFSVSCILGPLGWLILYVTLSDHAGAITGAIPGSSRRKKVEDYL
jgi:hypothetical protein